MNRVLATYAQMEIGQVQREHEVFADLLHNHRDGPDYRDGGGVSAGPGGEGRHPRVTSVGGGIDARPNAPRTIALVGRGGGRV